MLSFPPHTNSILPLLNIGQRNMKFPHAIPALNDNYIWLVANPKALKNGEESTNSSPTSVVIVDPGLAAPVIECLSNNDLQACAILVTHHHWDHTDGIEALVQHYAIPVYGPANSTIPQLNYPLHDNDEILLPNDLTFHIIATPGHTLDQINYYRPGMLFCGDTLFAAGCGRLFEGSATQMHQSLQRLAGLPDDTRIFCGHEYTLANLLFALAVEPDNKNIQTRLHTIQQLRKNNLITLPSTLAEERLSNPFLRCSEPSLMNAACHFSGKTITNANDTFKVIRYWKDTWQQ